MTNEGKRPPGRPQDDDAEIERTLIDPDSVLESPSDSSGSDAGRPARTVHEEKTFSDRTLSEEAAADRSLVEAPSGRGLPKIRGITLTGEIGRGGMGVVYKGQQGYLDRTVAVKLLAVNPQRGDFEKRFRREAKILAGLTHPNIVGCYQAGVTDEGECYLVMEFIDGPSLRQWIDKNGPVPLEQAIVVCRDVARALSHAHEAGIIHRDVKPENVLLRRDDKAAARKEFPFLAKLADLGLARATTNQTTEMNLTVQGSVMGTPATMAPEQFDDPDHVDFRADLYGLGCVLYHAVTGTVAYPQRTMSETIARKMDPVPPDPRRANPRIPGPAADLVTRLLARRREDRPQSYEAVIERCEQLLRTDLNMPMGKRRPWLIAGAGVGVLVLALGIWSLTHRSDSGPGEDPAKGGAEVPLVSGGGEKSEGNGQEQSNGHGREDSTNQGSKDQGSVKPIVQMRIEAQEAVQEDQLVELKAISSDSRAPGVRYRWRQEGEPKVTPSAPSTASWTFKAPLMDEAYKLVFSVVAVLEDQSESAPAEKTIQVSVNRRPTAKIKGPETVEVGQTVELEADASDPDGSGELRYRWECGAGSAVALGDADKPVITFKAPEKDEDYDLEIRLTTSDGSKDSATAKIPIRVKADPASAPLGHGVRFELANADKLKLLAPWGSPKGGRATFTKGENEKSLVATSTRDDKGAWVSCDLRRGAWELRGSIRLLDSKTLGAVSGLCVECADGSGIELRVVSKGATAIFEVVRSKFDPEAGTWVDAAFDGGTVLQSSQDYAPLTPVQFLATWDRSGGSKLWVQTGVGFDEVSETLSARPKRLTLFVKQGVAEFQGLEMVGL